MCVRAPLPCQGCPDQRTTSLPSKWQITTHCRAPAHRLAAWHPVRAKVTRIKIVGQRLQRPTHLGERDEQAPARAERTDLGLGGASG